MALRDQPYIPLYVQDFLTDEKLMRCSASATGVYIRLMCHMHKSENYGVFAIRDKDRISDDISDDFARVFSLFSPYSQGEIRSAFQELLDEGVIFIYRNWLCQKRMMNDGKLSDIRASAGRKGGQMKNNAAKNPESFATGFATDFATAKTVANTESEIEYENANESDKESDKENEETLPRAGANDQQARFDKFWAVYPHKVGKGEARKAWAKVKPSAVLHEKILTAIANAIRSEQWQRENGRYIPNPATWLNQGRWDDELPEQGAARRPQRGKSGEDPFADYARRAYDDAVRDDK